MKTTLAFFFFLMTSLCHSQVAHLFSIGTENYTLTFSKNDHNYDFDLVKSGDDNKQNFTLPKLDIGTFKNVVYQKLKTIDSTLVHSTAIDHTIEEAFYTVVANIDAIDDLNYAPIAGTLKINKYIYLYTDKRISWKQSGSTRLHGIQFEITNVNFVFQNGFIQDAVVDGKIIVDASYTGPRDAAFDVHDFLKANIKFTNRYGIGFSSKSNFRNLFRINLYPNQKESIENTFQYKKSKGKDQNIFDLNELHIQLGEVIQAYDFRNDLYTTDYSPANVKVTLEGGKSVTLYKDKTYKILEARVFSDFLGFNADKPNGLVQLELEKQFNFNTTRYKFLTYRLRAGIGYLEYLKLSGGICKIEDNNRFLVPEMQDEQVTSFTGAPLLLNKRYTTPVAVLNHQTNNIGVTANAMFLDMPSIKSQLHINGGFRFAQTKVQDSIRTLNADLTINSKVKEYSLPYWQFYPEVIWHILPETRYGFYASWRPKYFHSIAENIEYKGMLNEQTGIRRDNISSWVNEFELLGYLYTNEEKQNGKLFVRWRLNSEMGYSKNNFSQFQVGYSFYVLGRGKQK